MSDTLALNKPRVNVQIDSDYAADRILKISIYNPNRARCTLKGAVILYDAYSDVELYRQDIDIVRDAQTYYTISVDMFMYFDIDMFKIAASVYLERKSDNAVQSVSELCESCKSTRYVPVSAVAQDTKGVYLKAFCNIPSPTLSSATYVYWERSVDGVQWNEYDITKQMSSDLSHTLARVNIPTYDLFGNTVDLEEPSELEYATRTVWKLDSTGPLDLLNRRPDCVAISDTNNEYLWRMTMVCIRALDESEREPNDPAYTVYLNLGSSTYTPVISQTTEFLVSDIANASESPAMYYGNVLYNFNNPKYSNNLVASETGSAVRPMSRLTPLDVLENAYITSIVPWKEYLVCFTNNSIHLVSKVQEGFTSRTVNSFVGVPASDSRCCVSTLNGVIFKSDTKLYLVYPNVYAGEDSVLNVTEISKPIEEYLVVPDSYTPFAIGTPEAYILMLPYEGGTRCVKYHYTTKKWVVYDYPVQFQSSHTINISNIHVFGTYNGTVAEYQLDAEVPYAKDNCVVADLVQAAPSGVSWDGLKHSDILKPIQFCLDSGQKSDSLNYAKQFVESKFNITTLHAKDCFPMKITVYVDGCPTVITKDVNTDSAFWKRSEHDFGTLSTNFTFDSNTDLFNVFRQMFLRYSSKGKSIRHIIEGKSVYPFKIYEINYRYRNLNVKH